MISFGFGCYLVFYKGFWGLSELSRGFSIDVLLRTPLFLVLGYTVVSGLYRLVAFEEAVEEGRIRLREQGREEPKHFPDPVSLRLTGAMPPPRPVSAASVRCWSCKAPLALTE